ncbi:MFS transporter [bacterium]|nr:MFS transporter [bacterium]
MSRGNLSALFPFLLLLFTGTFSSSMVISFMAFFIVEGLGRDPWIISVYSVIGVTMTVITNRSFARLIDSGRRVFPLVGFACFTFLAAALSLAIAPTLTTVMTVGVIGFGLSSSAVSTMFSLGGNMAERQHVDRARFNAYMRATTSTAWMIGPAIAFMVADQFGPTAVFRVCFAAGLAWLLLWLLALPRDITARPKSTNPQTESTNTAKTAMFAAAGFVFCLSLAHSLTFTALPLFYVQEVGLPGYAPGFAFSVKTFVEVFAIFSTPFLISHFGLRTSLLGTSLLAVIAIQVLASVTTFPQMVFGAALEGLYYGFYASLGISYVQSFATDRPAQATAIYWNTLMVSGLLAGPAVGLIAQVYDFYAVLLVASGVAFLSACVLFFGSREPESRAPT